MEAVRRLLIIGFAVTLALLFFSFEDEDISSMQKNELKVLKVQNYVRKNDRNLTPSVDHSRFEVLKEPFASAHELTAACLSCHNGRAGEIMSTSHWKWEREEELEGKGVIPLGKKNILNNFCIGISGSEGTCTRCHIGYGWADKSFDFGDPTNIDCVVCHDLSGTYKKKKGGAGYPDESVDLNYVAQQVGSPKRENCGVCHFWGGGGNNVKHGDLEKAMIDCSREVDVHMTTEGENMSCVDCHVTDKHQMAGKLYALSSENINRATCEYCHTEKPHENSIINEHNLRVACQTCHIPIYAKATGTKMIWDWSTAGQLDENGHPKTEHDADGNHNYLSIKGNFVFNDHVIPEYYWFNGIANHQLITDKIETVPVQMNSLDGAYHDKGRFQKTNKPSKIWPVKVHRGKQIYDPVNNTLIQAKLWDQEPGNGAYWTDFDWNIAAQKGMDYLGLPYSGEYDFVETEMYWPLNHQVAPAANSLKCVDCHTRENGRLASLDDFYLPGRDYSVPVEAAGIIFILVSIFGIMLHTGCRILYNRSCFLQKLIDGGKKYDKKGIPVQEI
ncbi:MAG: tetrathionate reductase family octaheme c-type cytochrome [Bacteroidales bacterium]|nr:tetrathionate reductase family octaheme c-type cytochrome [Bacteroidales bacterium]MCF8405149.1 tetrathionate reductase family octaheme c-type cytochrome [Bacteroidales bacterium]